MNVSADTFEQTKQKILREKSLFIQNQLKDIEVRKGKLKESNTALKQQISTLKKNKNNNKSLLGCSLSSNSATWRTSSENIDANIGVNEQSNRRVKEYENKMNEMVRQKEQYLVELEARILELKNQCISKMAKKEKVERWRREAEGIRKSNQDTERKKLSKRISHEYACEGENQTHRVIANGRKKTVSVNLTDGFIHRISTQRASQNCSFLANNPNNKVFSRPTSSSHYINSNNSSLLYPKDESLNKSRQDFKSNRSSLISNSFLTSQTKKSQGNSSLNTSIMSNSRSYGKIITKIGCEGCGVQFRPNQYYSHITECRELQKINLLKERQEIDELIEISINNY